MPIAAGLQMVNLAATVPLTEKITIFKKKMSLSMTNNQIGLKISIFKIYSDKRLCLSD